MLFVTLLSCKENIENEYKIAADEFETTFYLSDNSDELLSWAVNDLSADIEEITGRKPLVIKTNSYQKNRGIYIGTFNDSLMSKISATNTSDLANQWEKFVIKKDNENLLIVGSDLRATVYGIFDLAERIGISPWKWWADVKVEQKSEINLILPSNGFTSSPSVQYRGIFLNDEDWGLQPWAAKTFEPETNDIGPKTYEKIFQLLLRLKANTIWPAMHNCTKAFCSIPGNKEMAQKYHIIIGSSHAEPMLRNNVDEWDRTKRGDFNYFSNSDEVNQYWKERIVEMKSANNEFIATVGMRGMHDGRMEGNATTEEKVEMLQTIFDNQRSMLENNLNKPIETIPQIFVPYKEVLDLYNAGLKVPDDVTLMWTDDNYGYIRRLSNEDEQKRSGGSGVYYHMSYWGRPHDYLWLSTTQPALIWFEMLRAYQNGAKKIWIANVGDIKPGEYNMEFFLDLAWDINMVKEDNIKSHLLNWAEREFGNEDALEIAELMDEYYRLAFLRKPEFMGWSRTEPTTQTKSSDFSITENGNELQRRINNYKALETKVENIKASIPSQRQNAFLQLVEYPVKGAAQMNYKFLYYQKSLDSENIERTEEYAELSKKAFDQIIALTDKYNEINNGKWEYMMDLSPRNLPVYKMPEFEKKVLKRIQTKSSTNIEEPIFINASNFTNTEAYNMYQWKSINGLGYSNSSITLFPLKANEFNENKPLVEYSFEISQAGKYVVEVRCLPTHSNNFDHEISISVDDKKVKSYKINTKGRSEDWKRNVLRNYTSVTYPIIFDKKGEHTLHLSVNQTGIVIDQIAINSEKNGNYYEIQK